MRPGSKKQHIGKECEVPGCKTVGEDHPGATKMHKTKGRIVCDPCYQAWDTHNGPWPQFAKDRQTSMRIKANKPPMWENTKFPILAKPIPCTTKKNPKKHPCEKCIKTKGDSKPKAIENGERGLCSNCSRCEQFIGRGVCWSCGRAADGSILMQWTSEEEGIFSCGDCKQKVGKYKLPSYRFLKEHIRTVVKCHICKTAIAHGCGPRKGGLPKNTRVAAIDHTHYKDLSWFGKRKYGKSGQLRGVICAQCNTAQGLIKLLRCPLDWAKSLVKYLTNPPLEWANHQVVSPPLKKRDYRSYWQRFCGFFRQGHA